MFADKEVRENSESLVQKMKRWPNVRMMGRMYEDIYEWT
jgi:hypothetical protein